MIYWLTTTGEIRILDIDNMDYYCISTCGAVIYGSRYFCVDDDNIKTTLVSKEKSEDKLVEHTIKINRYSKYVELENINWESKRCKFIEEVVNDKNRKGKNVVWF